MKIPQSWNDKSLLEDEPFQSAFCKLATGAKAKGAHRLFTSVANDLRKISNIDCIIEQWLELAFFGLERKKLSKLYTKCDFRDLQLFAEIQSYLARSNDVAAFKTINRQRIVRGLKPFDDVSAFEEAHAIHVEKKKRVMGTRPEGPFITRQRELASHATKPLSLTGSGATNSNLQKSLRTKTFTKHPAVQSEQNKKLSRKRCADTIDSRPAKKPLLSTTQKREPVKVKLPKSGPSGHVTTRKNPPRSAKHRDKTTGSMDGFVKEVPEQDAVNHRDTGTAISETQPAPTECEMGISRHHGLPQPDTRSSPKPFDNQPPDKRLPVSSNESGGNKLGETGKVDSSNLSQDIVHSSDSTIEQQSQVTSDPLTNITVDILTNDDHDPTCAVQSRKYISFYAPDDCPSTALHEMLDKEDAHIVQTVPDPEPDRFSQSWQPVLEVPSLPVKRPLPFYPPIWAQSRQEVCETFDWFRSYQGGVYHSNEMVKGYLLSGFPSSRDRFEHEGRLIISHGGGKAESLHSNKGQMASHQATDQLAQDKSIRALLNNHRHGRPLALLIDDKYALFPFDIGIKDIAYAVLGFYTIAHVWAEYQPANNELGRVVRYKFAFRWCEDQGSPWWLKEDVKRIAEEDTVMFDSSCTKYENPVPVHPEDSCSLSSTEKLANSDTDSERHPVQQDPLSDTKIRCAHCSNYSPKIFLQQWTCLTPECIMFWKQAEGELHGQLINDLTYDPQFLALPPHKPLPYGYKDALKSLSKRDVAVESLRNYHITRGYHCSKCGRLSCRFQWEKWECLHCLNFLNIFVPIHLAQDIWNQVLPMSYKDYNVNPISEIVSITSGTFTHDAGRGIITSFVLPYDRGKIHVIQTTNPRGREEADKIFFDYQTQAAAGVLKFRRWPLRAHKCRGPLLTNYFSHNAGKPYKYIAGDANTVPFDSAPAVCAARALIEKRIRQALNISTEFNEVLSAAYMERQRMAFHSDNEVGLGPVVAGLSLGSPALMHFRLHARFDPEREKRGIMLSIVLRHGDVLVMDGAGIQEYYEHTVVPNNFRIAATARQIGAAHS